VALRSAGRPSLPPTCGRWDEPSTGCGNPHMAENRDGPRRGTSGAVDAPDSGGRSWCAGTLNPEGECAYPNDEPFGWSNANGVQTTQVATHARRWHPANGVPSDRETCELPSVNLLVAVGQARHDRSISGLPARGCPFVSRGRRALARRPISLSTPIQQQIKVLTFGRTWESAADVVVSRAAVSQATQVRRPTRTASAIRPPSSAPATMAWAQCVIHSATPCREPVPYAASAPR